ncbi:MAG: response regulator [Elusimicrobia bacterium]|nr:response regulator [Elusimicrobiota bacterium]
MSRAAHEQPRVVIVDDEAIVCESLRLLLEQAGFHAVAVDDGRRALERIRAEKPDLIVLDLYMPGVDGREIARAVKADPDVKDARILLLTGSSEAVDVVTGLDAGAADYAVKPINGDDLIAKIRGMLNLAADEPKPVKPPRKKR